MKSPSENYISLKKLCTDMGADLFGVADIQGIKESFLISPKILEKIDKAISLGIMLSKTILEEIDNVPTQLYSHHYKTVNTLLDLIALKASYFIQKAGYKAISIPASQILDWQTHKAHLSHKEVACLAGLGWIGRNNLLVNKGLGSCLRLVTILTDMPLTIDKPSYDNCGACHACIEICPAQAIKENPADFDHKKCYDKLKEFERKKIVTQYICGVCVNACRGDKK